MDEKRKDNKGRILHKGESQRADGMYMFRYTDRGGNRKTVYSWKLIDTDRQPENKKESVALRELEKTIQRDIDDGIDTYRADKTTVNDMFDIFLELRDDLAVATRCNYIGLYNSHIRNRIGYKSVSSVKHTDFIRTYNSLLRDDSLSFTTVEKLHCVLYQLFELAVRDDLIRSNPSADSLKELRRKTKKDPPKKRHALTREQQSRLIDFVYQSKKLKKWGAFLTVLLGTGMRIGEALGLRWDDCDFENGFINVNHAILYKPTETSGYRYMISEPKTSAGYRKIPMLTDVRRALLTEMNRRYRPKSFTVDGYTDFIFLNDHGQVFTPAYMYDTLQRIVAEYNANETILAEKENRDPCLVPRISAHILRHTFCTRICESEVNLKVIQDVMGHKDISTTMNVYNEATEEKKKEDFDEIDGKIKVVGSSILV